MTPAMLAALQAAAAARRPVAYAKRLDDGLEFLLPDPAAGEALNEAGAQALAADKSATVEVAGSAWFIEARNPAPRLVVVGAVHIAQSLVPFGLMAGYDAVIVDPRTAFGNAERFPQGKILNAWPDEALDALPLDSGCAVVALMHDPKLDDPALDRALRSDAFYIGALGSRKSQAARLERLRTLGHGDAALARIRGPVGLRIGAVTAPEIALSIIAEIVAVRRHGALAERGAS